MLSVLVKCIGRSSARTACVQACIKVTSAAGRARIHDKALQISIASPQGVVDGKLVSFQEVVKKHFACFQEVVMKPEELPTWNKTVQDVKVNA